MATQIEKPVVSEEFENQPVPSSHLKGAKSFWGMYAGEHTAGTEFMLGPLFVAWGVAPMDLIFGLLLGNILAVLSWRYILTPIATSERLTLYKQLEKICGGGLVKLYNLANGVLFCFLAGAMITVSATAVGIWFNVDMPGLQDTLPTGVLWCLVVIGIGLCVSLVAAFGYDSVARLANLAAPWMILIFVACALVTIPKLQAASLDDIWTGVPMAGLPKLGFWHVVFFAWFCNAAMHIGMSDLSILRYARKKSMGWAPAIGMFLGHYIAWIAASLLFALAIQRYGIEASNAPGPMVDDALGIAGLICVIIAGWTTANPTIYRAGLAFQAIMPSRSRFAVTMTAGLLATAAGLFPAFAMKLLDFVGIYGTILAPMGAVIFVDFYFSRKVGITPYYAEQTGVSFNPVALVAWLVPVGLAAWVWIQYPMVFKSFTTLPAWLGTGILYLFLGKLFLRKTGGGIIAKPILAPTSQSSTPDAGTVPAKKSFLIGFPLPRKLAVVMSIIALVATLVTPTLYMLEVLNDTGMKVLMLASTGLWFFFIPIVIRKS